jgi:L-ascorbate metabolism protein UlaG (beta-lactamase superfamily)
MNKVLSGRDVAAIIMVIAVLGIGGPGRAAAPASPPPGGGSAGPLTLTYVANMGVLVCSGETKVLIDALFDKPNPDYRAPAPEVLEKIMTGAPPFDGVDLVLVTHNHPDHFDADLVVRYLETFAEPLLVAPADALEAMRQAAADWPRIEPRVVSLDLKVGEKIKKDLKRIPLAASRTLHSGDLDAPMNLMYLFELDGRRVWHEGDSNGKPEVFRGFGLGRTPVDLAVVHYWFPLEPNCARFLQEELKVDHIALGHLPIRLEGDAPGKIDLVRQDYKDIFLLLPGTPAKVLQKEAGSIPERSFGRIPPGEKAAKFWPEVLSGQWCPHGQLAFTPDGTGVFWSAILPPGPEQTILYSAFDGNKFARPAVAAFAAVKGRFSDGYLEFVHQVENLIGMGDLGDLAVLAPESHEFVRVAGFVAGGRIEAEPGEKFPVAGIGDDDRAVGRGPLGDDDGRAGESQPARQEKKSQHP